MSLDLQFPYTTASGLLTTLLLLLALRAAYKSLLNFYTARSIGLPIVFSPTDQTGILWSILSVQNRARLARVVPGWLWRRIALTIPGWEVYHQPKPFDAGGAASQSRSFVLAGPSEFEVWTVDPVAVHDVLQRVHDFAQAKALSTLFGKYGPNVITANGERWARYRKPVATVLNERISKASFEAAVRHAHEVLGPYLRPSSSSSSSSQPRQQDSAAADKLCVPQLFDTITNIVLNVLISASIGDNKFPWSLEQAHGRPEPGYKLGYTEALHLYVDNVFGIGMLPLSVITAWPSWLPGHAKISAVGHAIVEYRRRMKSLLNLERDRLLAAGGDQKPMPPLPQPQPPQGRVDLLALLVKASEDEANTGMALTEDELVSNLFVFIAGGFKTIAAALHTALLILAAYPEWQDWLLEEVDAITPSSSPEKAESWEYARIYPQAVRTVAFILEMMRLHGSSTRLTRVTAGPQLLHTSSGATLRVPAKTRINIDSMALHVLPVWAGVNRESDPPFVQNRNPPDGEMVPDERAFRPSRWINPPGAAARTVHYLPPKGTYLPWGTGPRVCPGQKMAQVEIATVLLQILRDHRVEACGRAGGETPAQAADKFRAALRDVVWGGILQVKRNPGLYVRFARRK